MKTSSSMCFNAEVEDADIHEVVAALGKAVSFITTADRMLRTSRDLALVDYVLESIPTIIGANKNRQAELGATPDVLENTVKLVDYCQHVPSSCAKGMNAVLFLCQCGPDKASFNGKTARRLGALGMLEIIAEVLKERAIVSNAVLAEKVGGQ